MKKKDIFSMVASGPRAQRRKREWAGPALPMISFLVYMTLTQLLNHFDLFFKRTQRLREIFSMCQKMS